MENSSPELVDQDDVIFSDSYFIQSMIIIKLEHERQSRCCWSRCRRSNSVMKIIIDANSFSFWIHLQGRHIEISYLKGKSFEMPDNKIQTLEALQTVLEIGLYSWSESKLVLDESIFGAIKFMNKIW